MDYFSQYRDQLDEDSLRRLSSNPLRILDSKNPALQNFSNWLSITNSPMQYIFTHQNQLFCADDTILFQAHNLEKV